jgi:N-acetylmuramoyl-L-alanine amidase
MIPNDATILNGYNISNDVLRFVRIGKKPIKDFNRIIDAYAVFGRLTTMGNLLPFAQAVHETGWFTSDRWVQNNNPAGLGATNDGAMGFVASSIEEGILAQYAHLVAYAVPLLSMSVLQLGIVGFDPRGRVMRGNKLTGSASRWIDLNGRWAVPGTTYGQRIIEIANQLLKYEEHV